ncbi:MAG: sugar transporter [Alphaproteobacteria bacterium]|nr:sugar transporter [Alphaproteobacteria bacterium]
MKELLVKLRETVASRLDQRNGDDAPGTVRASVVDVRARTMKSGGYRWVLLVTALAALYYALLASDRYVTEAQLYVKSTKGSAPTVPELSLLTGGSSQAQDALLLQSYILSADMLRILDEKIGLKAHFSGRDWDFWSRLEADPTEEEFLDYYRNTLSLSINAESAILTIQGEGYTPEFSQAFVQAVLEESDRFINGVNQAIAKQEIAFVEAELGRARGQVDDVRARMLAFQNENQILSPEATGAAIQSVVNQLEGELVRLQTEQKTLASYLNDTAPQLVDVNTRIDSVKAQLAEERAKISSQDTQSINEVYADFKELELELKFATDMYKAALTGLEQARVESYHKMKHLVVLQSPGLPDEALKPRKLYNLATLFVVLSLAYGIVTMILATIREHRDV